MHDKMILMAIMLGPGALKRSRVILHRIEQAGFCLELAFGGITNDYLGHEGGVHCYNYLLPARPVVWVKSPWLDSDCGSLYVCSNILTTLTRIYEAMQLRIWDRPFRSNLRFSSWRRRRC